MRNESEASVLCECERRVPSVGAVDANGRRQRERETRSTLCSGDIILFPRRVEEVAWVV